MVESFHPLAHAAVATTCGSTLFIMRQRPVDTNQMTIKQLQTELQSLGIKAGDTLMVHTSIRSVGLDRASWDWLEVVSKVREARVEAIVSACTEP